MMARADLPTDVDTCHDIILELYNKNQRLAVQLQHILQRREQGRASNGNDGQLALFAEQLAATQADGATEEEASVEVAGHKRRRKGHGRKKRDLRVERVIHDVPQEDLNCPCCGRLREKIGEDISRQLEYETAELYTLEHVRLKYACKRCEGEVIVADKPHQPIEKGLAGPGLLSFVATSKYCDHQPLHRLERILARLGGDISRSTMCDWMAACAALIMPLYRLMVARVLESKIIHTDDTSVPVLDHPMTRTKSGRLWVYLGDGAHPYTVYEYSPTHEGQWPQAFLKPFTGYLQADAYLGYDRVFEDGSVKEVACWAHARRKFEEAQSSDPARSLTAITMIRKLYDVEREARDWTPDKRRQLRQEKSRPQLANIKEWVQAQSLAVLPKNPIADAIGYLANHWAAFERYTEDGDLNIDNNASERALRDVVVGRRNWLFAGSDQGGCTAAILISLIASCKRHAVDPFAYFRDVFKRLPATPHTQIDQFLPDRWQKPAE